MKSASIRNDGAVLSFSKKITKFTGKKENKEENKPVNKLPLYLLGAAAFGGAMLFASGKLPVQKMGSIGFAGKRPSFRKFEVTGKKADITNEFRLSSIARKLGINTPKISADKKYKIYGMEADPKTNPVDGRHFKSILDDIFKMDKGEIYHGDLEKAHIFYSKDGKAEVDCFRFGYLFSEKPWEIEREFPKAMYPTNATQFENLSLGHYISKISDDTEKTNFLSEYLKESSIFHQKRADFLIQSHKGTPEQIQYEKLQAELFNEPDSEITDLFKKRIEMQYGHRKMFTDWDEGFGACGHTPDETRTTDAVISYFDVVKANMQYLEDLKTAKAGLPEGKMREYLNFEEQYASHWLKNHSDSIKGMGGWTLNPENKINQTHRLVSEEQRGALEDLFNKFEQTPGFGEKLTALDAAKEKYLELLKV